MEKTTRRVASHQLFDHTDFIHDYTMLAPKFFSRQMNISTEILCNLFKIWLDAIQSIFNQNFVKYDALVGENACHVRAIALIDIHFKLIENLEFKVTLEELIHKVNSLIKECRSVLLKDGDKKITIYEFLHKNKLLFYMPEHCFYDIKFIIDSYFLTLTKETLPANGFTLNEKTNYHYLSPWGFAKNKAKNIVSCAQKSLSHASCEYVKHEACYLGSKAFKYLLSIKHDAHERSFMPQFIVAKVLFQRALNKNYKIILKINRYLQGSLVDQIFLYFKPNSFKTDFEICDTISYGDPCIVLSGVVNYLSDPESERQYILKLISSSFLEIIYANFASHPQYSGELKNIDLPFNELISVVKNELNNLENTDQHEKIIELTNIIYQIEQEFIDFGNKKNFALRYGCCLDNPSFLFLNHIYADTPGNYFSTKKFYQDSLAEAF